MAEDGPMKKVIPGKESSPFPTRTANTSIEVEIRYHCQN